jgi:hypothetical protein
MVSGTTNDDTRGGVAKEGGTGGGGGADSEGRIGGNSDAGAGRGYTGTGRFCALFWYEAARVLRATMRATGRE